MCFFRYMSQGELERLHHLDFARFEILRKEYLNQTFNFMPEIQKKYDKSAKNSKYEEIQMQITNKESYSSKGINYRLNYVQTHTQIPSYSVVKNIQFVMNLFGTLR